MSNLKRKDAPGGHPPAKSAKGSKEARPSTKTAPSKSIKSPSNAVTKPLQAPVVSALKDEEPIFPRGGGSILTPLEQKQINLEAKADARREEEFDTGGKAQKKQKRKTSAKKTEKKQDASQNEDTVRIESLNFKKLVKGSLVLGQISQINPLDLEVSLPNNLIGHVSIVAVSEQLTERLQDTTADNENDDEDSSDESDIDLASIFVVGQYVRVYVVSTREDSVVGKGKRRIELSMKPSESNTGLTKDDVVANSTVMATVVSVEERGCVMDVGIPDLRAFLPNAEVDSQISQERLQPGAVFLSQVTSKGSSGKIAQLSLQQKKLGNVKDVPHDATTISTFLPGTAVNVLVTNTDSRGLTGKVLGHLDVTADLIHSGVGPKGVDIESTYKISSQIKARVICNFALSKEPKLGISLLPHVTSLGHLHPEGSKKSLPTDALPISSFIENCTVRKVAPDIGLFVDTNVSGLPGFVHISRIKDGRIDALYESSGPYKTDSVHKGRVVGYNEIDGLFHISFEKSVLEQPYIRVEDVPIGAVMTCPIEKMVIDERGVGGLVLKIAEGISGFVPESHLADVRLQHPEKKFREGAKVKTRVLSKDVSKKQIRLTLKKTLVNSEAPTVSSFDEVSVGMQFPGTIVKLQNNGAHIQFYGALKGFLPVAEMSEAYIRDPSDHFRVGQVVSVHVLDVDPALRRLVVSCKDPGAFGLDKQTALKNLEIGEIVSADVTQKTEDQVFVELVGSRLKATLPVGHLTDKSASKNQYALKRIAAGQTLSNLMVIDKNDSRRAITITQKPSLIQASKSGRLLAKFEDAKEGVVVSGFVRNITQTAVFVQFAGSLNALLPKSRLAREAQSKTDFGMQKYDSIEVKIVSVIQDMQRIMVAPASSKELEQEQRPVKAAPADDLVLGSVTKARITSVKETQLNVQIVDSQAQGRIDVSQIFGTWNEIDNPKKPLDKFNKKQLLRVKVMGIHDAKDHRFLPFSHRSAHSVLELTAKPADFDEDTPAPLSINSIKVGDTHIAFVNNVSSQYLWVNISPSVRGRISAMEASDDLSQLNDLEANFPVGSALKVRVASVDPQNNHLDLSARSKAAEGVTWQSLKPKMILPGKITKVNERQILVKLSETVSGPVHLPDMTDNFDNVNTLNYKKNDIVRVSVIEVDASNKRLRLSTRPSRIMSSTLPVEDKEVSDITQLLSGEIVRGFVKNVSDKGLFVLLGGQVTALVKIANLSDRFLKEWKDEFQVDQLVKGRIVHIDPTAGQLELSLKSSIVDENYTPPITFNDLEEGQVVTGKVRKVEDFGAFVLVDNSANISGLCHRSQMADKPVKDATKLFKEGDVVKAKILQIDMKKRRISFGLNPSLFDDEDSDMDSDDSDAGAALLDLEAEDDSDDDMDEDDGQEIQILGTDNFNESDIDEDNDESDDGSVDDVDMEDAVDQNRGLGVGKKAAWSADPFAEPSTASEPAKTGQVVDKKSNKRKSAEIQVDRTAELDVNGPQTSSDYERLLLGQPDSSELWIAYMAFQMQVSELPKAREVAERAIKTINIREETEKLNVWVAYLNLEVAYGTKSTVEEVFKRACQYSDEQEVYERLASIYIQSEKYKDADNLFEAMIKKFGARSPSIWTNYAHFLHVTRNEPVKARALLPRATQQLDKHLSQNLAGRFAALEFRSPNGKPELGRTMFEGLLATFPKKGDLWNQLLDLEIGIAGSDADATAVRDVFERRTRIKGLKPQQAEKWFRRWATWEEKINPKGKGKIMAKAQEWAAAYKAKKEAEAAAEDDMEE